MHQVFKCVCSCIFMICGLLISNSVIIKLMLKPKPVFQTVVYLVRECVKVKTGLTQRKINDFHKFYDFLLLKNSRALNKTVVYRFSTFEIVGIFLIKPEGSINHQSQFHTTNQLWLFSDGLTLFGIFYPLFWTGGGAKMPPPIDLSIKTKSGKNSGPKSYRPELLRKSP